MTTPREGEREFEIGKDEFWSTGMAQVFANTKRTYDEYQNESLESVRQNRSYVSKVLSDAQENHGHQQALANLALANAVQLQTHSVETANMVGKQAVRHGDLAIDRQWNVDEVAALVAKTPVFLDAIAAAVAEAVRLHEHSED